MLDLDFRYLMLILWGGGTVATYGRVLWRRLEAYRVHHDRRSRRDMAEAIGLFLTALASALSVAVFLLHPSATDMSRTFSTVALGAFLAVGIYMAQETPSDGDGR